MKPGYLYNALSIREMIDGNPARLRYTFRYSTSRVSAPESVAEHSYYVAFYSLMIGRWYNNRPNRDPQDSPVNIGLLLTRALVHDLEEARSGDFPRLFKHSTPELKQILDQASEVALAQMLEPLLPGPDVPGPASREAKHMLEIWRTAKDDSLEGRIIEFSDFLSVLGFMLQERDSGGNRNIDQHVADMSAYYGKFRESRFDFLGELVYQCDDLMKEVWPEHK